MSFYKSHINNSFIYSSRESANHQFPILMFILIDNGHGLMTPGKRIRTDYSDNDPDWAENFYLLRKTLCVAVLSENFFMDSHSDLEYLQSRAGKQAIVDTHVEGIIEYLESKS